jgi:hypothetical protein
LPVARPSGDDTPDLAIDHVTDLARALGLNRPRDP